MASSSKELDLGGLILQVLEEKGQLDSFDFSREAGREHQTVVGAIKSLQSVGNVVSTEQRQFESWVLTGEGQEVVENGSHEARVYNASSIPNAKVGFSKAMSAGWLRIDSRRRPSKGVSQDRRHRDNCDEMSGGEQGSELHYSDRETRSGLTPEMITLEEFTPRSRVFNDQRVSHETLDATRPGRVPQIEGVGAD
ncbi:Phenylalanine--tRNA ligase alpha subunit [Geodia barretti]|uniref:Phenylalanine--tRNA ligase alpha subunit n=1 Tax=Geodia barretti TaxID=519541 RepID=A0AA35SS34_GEOBA|nr:Phenylalanine--tRNA ligase alpha subunit [Geodia barretti]